MRPPAQHSSIGAAPAVRLLMIDNYDSFTFNLVQHLESLHARVTVRRNDAVPPDFVLRGGFDGLVISPGPGRPEAAGASLAAVQAAAASRLPQLGVCLGHQAIAVAFGGRVSRARRLMHGKTSRIEHDGLGVFGGLPSPLTATRYHSLAVDETTLPEDLQVSARSEDGEIMGLRHRELPIEGVQFHPESILTGFGAALLARFVSRCTHRARAAA